MSDRTTPPCHRCGKPIPPSWSFVMLCDPCLTAALDSAKRPDDAVFVGVDDEED